MNEYEDIARFFANEQQPEPNAEFIAAVRSRIERERRQAKWVAAAGSLVVVLVLSFALLAWPVELLYPLRFVQDFLTSFTGIVACAVCAVALTAWLRIEDV